MVNIKHDGTLDLAVGKKRNAPRWRNTQMLWSDFVARVATTHRTPEKHAEYLNETRGRQAEIKDVGGYVGGYLQAGKRKGNSVMHRQLLTLDLDYCTQDFWLDFEMNLTCAAVLYSTHKHSPKAPRYRLVMPVNRELDRTEYEALARRVAGILDIELFDPTTFQPERLMHWPSTSVDAEYVFHVQDGDWIDADEHLAHYVDYTDSSAWPLSSKARGIVGRAMKKQGDPLEKEGVVGAWCRTYSIRDALDLFLGDVYEACDVEDRYTYLEGTTGAGLVLYEDKFAYSHHGTDPISGKLCNAFDLVRVHLYGLQDEDVADATPTNKRPSYLAMLDMARKDKNVSKLLVTEKLERTRADFADFLDDELLDDVDLAEGSVPGGGSGAIDEELLSEFTELEEVDDAWLAKLATDRKGNILVTIDNVMLILENDKYLAGRIAYDDFEKNQVVIKNLPWRKVTQATRWLTDRDDSHIRHYLEKAYGISHTAKVLDAMEMLCTKNSFHPIRDYLSAIVWDGQERLDTVLIDYQGAEDNKYVRTITRKAFVAMVARVFVPGIKFDNLIVLMGMQGSKKSTLLSNLGRQWFSDSLATIQGKEALEALQGVWLVEMAELSALKNADVEKIKHFVAKKDDRYRVAYGRRPEKFLRQCVFWATTNKLEFLKDPSGERRFWPVRVNVTKPKYDVFDMSEEVIGQIWAEAKHRWDAGEKLYLNDEIKAMAEAVQALHKEKHPWKIYIDNYIDTLVPEGWPAMDADARREFLRSEGLLAEIGGTHVRSRICVLEIYHEAISHGREPITAAAANIIKDIMDNYDGWVKSEKVARYGPYGPQRNGYFRDDAQPRKVVQKVTE